MRLTTRRRIFAISLAILMALGFVAHSRTTSAQAAGGRLRFVHGVPGAPAVDISVDDVVAARNVEYANATRYLNVAVGNHAISIAATGTTNPIYKGKVTSAAGQAQTVILQGTLATVELGVYEDDLGPVAAGNTRMTAINALKDGPSVDIVKGDNSPLIQGLKYGTPYGGFDVPAMATALNVIPTGGDASSAVLKIDSLSLAAGTHNTLVVLGTVSGTVKPSYLLLTAATDAADPATSVQVRFVHAAPGAQAVDVYAGDKLVVPALAFGAATPHIALDANAGALSVRAAGSAPSSPLLASMPGGLNVKAFTVVVANAGDGVALEPSNDDVSTLDPQTARINVINATGTLSGTSLTAGNASLKLGGNVTLVGNPPQINVKASEVPAGTYSASVSVDKPAIQISSTLALSGGVLYDLVIAGNDSSSQLIVAATGLNEQPSSAPAPAGSAVAQANTPAAPATQEAQPTQAATAAVAPAATATLVPTDTAVPPTDVPPTLVPATEAPTSPDVVTSEPTNSPDVVTSEPDQPQATQAPQGIIGTVVNMNQGANLKLREYPRSDSRTLALLPVDTTFTIEGIQDPRAPTATGAAATPQDTPTAGPTPTIPSKGVDADTLWLYASWDVPAGGNVTGWVSAQFVDVERDGKPVKTAADLFTLKFIPGTQPGEVNSGSITPIAESNQIIATVDQINDGTNLQMRRTPGIDGESLALIPAKAQTIVLQQTDVKLKGLVGEPTSPTWLFVRYETESGSVTGWINLQYVTITRNGRKLPDLKDVPVAQTIQRGFTEGSAQTVKPPAPAGIIATVNKAINEGVNLQLRRDPTADAESIGLIPAGSELQVQGRNADGNWLQVSVQGQTGWVNSQFVTLTKNGKAYDIADLTIVTGEKNLIGTVTPGPSPTVTLKPTAAG